ncbi:MAG TPA: LCP family protein [Patescibacteria group bacterium]|nr:LCP family protein [Patescibacteria group bacterium]
MPKIEVDFLPNNKKKHPKPHRFKRLIASLIIILIVILAVFSSSVVFSDESLIRNLAKFNIFEQFGRLIRAGDRQLTGEIEDRINILIIGMGGKNHEGGTLADTIILASFKPSTQQVAMMSIPRDLSIPTDAYSWMKINAVHAYAEIKDRGNGGKTLSSELSKILDDNINYYATVDFDGFQRIIDEFGGVDIEVERDLIDYSYPIRGKEYVFPLENRFETLNIKAGMQHMDGELALKYARSRHALGVEGSDFARARRQQKIIAALKEKIFSVKTFFSPKKINSLLSAYNDHIITNLEIWEMMRLAQIGQDIDISKIISQTISDAPNGLLYATSYNGAYVLVPIGENFDQIKYVWQHIFDLSGDDALASQRVESPTDTSKPEETLPVTPEPAKERTFQDESADIEIQNGTWTAGWAGQEQDRLTDLGFIVSNATNADSHNYNKTVVYDLSGGAYPMTASELAKIYTTEIADDAPLTIDSSADFVIILGQ